MKLGSLAGGPPKAGRGRVTMAAAALAASIAIAPSAASAFPQNPSTVPTNAPPPADFVPLPLRGIEIVDKVGAFAPKDLVFRTHDGKQVTLGDYFKDGKPVLVTMAYYECPMLCSIVLNGLKNGLRDLAWTAGKEFHVLTVSFDPRDTPETARRKRQAYVEAYGRPVGDKGWDYLVGPPSSDPSKGNDDANALELAKVMGFGYRWDPKTNQYAHAAGAFLFTPDGRLSRTYYGIAFSERDLRLGLTEASAGKLGSAWDRVLLLCYHYDPNEHSYVLAGKRMMRAGGALTALLVGTFLLRLWRKDLTGPRPASGGSAAKKHPQDPPPPEATS